jgi:hypothetical protein
MGTFSAAKLDCQTIAWEFKISSLSWEFKIPTGTLFPAAEKQSRGSMQAARRSWAASS